MDEILESKRRHARDRLALALSEAWAYASNLTEYAEAAAATQPTGRGALIAAASALAAAAHVVVQGGELIGLIDDVARAADAIDRSQADRVAAKALRGHALAVRAGIDALDTALRGSSDDGVHDGVHDGVIVEPVLDIEGTPIGITIKAMDGDQ